MKTFAAFGALAFLCLSFTSVSHARYASRPGVNSLTASGDTKRDAFAQGRRDMKEQCRQINQFPQIISERMTPITADNMDHEQDSGNYRYTVRFRCGQPVVYGLPIVAKP